MDRGAVGVLPARKWRQLVEVAAGEFAQAGYEQASLNRIISACGMSKSSFYHYIESKRQLYDLVVGHLAEALVRAADIPEPEDFHTGDFWRRAGDFLGRLLAAAESDPLFTDLGRIFYLSGVPTAGPGAVGQAVLAVETWLGRVLAVGRESGAVRQDMPAGLQVHTTIAVLRAFDEWGLRHRANLDQEATQRLVDTQLAALERLLAPDR